MVCDMGVMFDKEADGTMATTHGGGTPANGCIPPLTIPAQRSCILSEMKCCFMILLLRNLPLR